MAGFAYKSFRDSQTPYIPPLHARVRAKTHAHIHPHVHVDVQASMWMYGCDVYKA